MNIEQYLKQHSKKKDLDINTLLDLFFQEEYFYTFSNLLQVPMNSVYMSQEINKSNVGLIFTSEELANKFYKKESLDNFFKLEKFKTTEFEIYINKLLQQNSDINGMVFNYPFDWVIFNIKN